MKDAPTLPVIHKDEPYEDSLNYDLLYKEGIERIGAYSGEIWNNYNESDPGITILETLCYALTELGYKSDMPIEDILAEKNGTIRHQDRFVSPPRALGTNPVNLVDFKKWLVDSALEIKQVYFEEVQVGNLTTTFIPYVELRVEQEVRLETKGAVLEKIQQELSKRSNLGQVFNKPVLLKSVILNIDGKVVVDSTVNVDAFAAALIYSINNMLSPYPVFYSYEALLEKGMRNDQIFDGPVLYNGFLLDENFNAKRKLISAYELMSAIDGMDGVVLVDDMKIEDDLEVYFDEALYVDFDSLFTGQHQLKIIQNGSVVTWLSSTQVAYELKKLISEPKKKFDFEQYMPKGVYSEIDHFYSIQHHFPEVYNLTRSNFNNNPMLEGKVRQLKAYLAVFEQVMANFLAQLSATGKLFDFDSGRSVRQVVGKTYFYSDIYDVPGIQYLLKDVKGYSKYYGEYPSDVKDWNAYKRDLLNPYRQQLNDAVESTEINLERKTRVFKHLLARFGVRYDNDYLHLNNPTYGKSETAAVQRISETLRQFAFHSRNRTRTYFYLYSKYALLSGMELCAGDQLNLNAYYRGLIEMMIASEKEKFNDLTVVVVVNKKRNLLYGNVILLNEQSVGDSGVEVYHGKVFRFSFSIDVLKDKGGAFKNNKKDLLDNVLNTMVGSRKILTYLNRTTKGFVAIDVSRLQPFLNFKFRINLAASLGQTSTTSSDNHYDSGFMSFDDLSKVLGLIESELPFIEHKEGSVFEIGVQTYRPVLKIKDEALTDEELYQQAQQANSWYSICQNIESENDKDELLKILHAVRGGKVNLIKFLVEDVSAENEEGVPFPYHFFMQKMFCFFPGWIGLFHQEEYQSFLMKVIMGTVPAGMSSDVALLDTKEMYNCLKYYKRWMKGVKRQNEGLPLLETDKKNAIDLFNFLIKCND